MIVVIAVCIYAAKCLHIQRENLASKRLAWVEVKKSIKNVKQIKVCLDGHAAKEFQASTHPNNIFTLRLAHHCLCAGEQPVTAIEVDEEKK